MIHLLAALTDGVKLPPGATPHAGGAGLFTETLLVFWIGGGIFALLMVWAYFKYGRKRSGKRKRRNRQIISGESPQTTRVESTTSRRRNPTLAEAGGLPPRRTPDAGTPS